MISVCDNLDDLYPIALHDGVWGAISDDYCQKDDFKFDSHHVYLSIKHDDVLAGFFMLRFDSMNVAWVHTAVHPDFWGNGRVYAKQLLAWLYENTDVTVLCTLVPENNGHAKSLCQRCGMEIAGTLRGSIKKGGEFLDQYIFSVGRGNFLCQ